MSGVQHLKMLDFSIAYERITPDGWLSKGEAKCLWETTKKTQGTIVEIGSYQGRSTMLLAQLGRPLVCIDPWDDNFNTEVKGETSKERFDANLQDLQSLLLPLKLDITTVRTKVESWTPVPAGLVYCDGDHTYEGTVAQANAAIHCDPTYIAAHDVSNSGGGRHVTRGVLDVLGPWDLLVETLAIWKLK